MYFHYEGGRLLYLRSQKRPNPQTLLVMTGETKAKQMSSVFYESVRPYKLQLLKMMPSTHNDTTDFEIDVFLFFGLQLRWDLHLNIYETHERVQVCKWDIEFSYRFWGKETSRMSASWPGKQPHTPPTLSVHQEFSCTFQQGSLLHFSSYKMHLLALFWCILALNLKLFSADMEVPCS